MAVGPPAVSSVFVCNIYFASRLINETVQEGLLLIPFFVLLLSTRFYSGQHNRIKWDRMLQGLVQTCPKIIAVARRNKRESIYI